MQLFVCVCVYVFLFPLLVFYALLDDAGKGEALFLLLEVLFLEYRFVSENCSTGNLCLHCDRA